MSGCLVRWRKRESTLPMKTSGRGSPSCRESFIGLRLRNGRFHAGFSLPEQNVTILLAAIEARATHLLKGDLRYFGPYVGKKIGGIAIALPGEYVSGRVSEN